MVNEEVVKSTIKRMIDAEIDDETIVSTLKDIGLDDAKAKSMIDEVKNGGSSESETDKNVNEENEETGEDSEEEVEDDELNDLKNVKSELETQSQVKDLHDTTTHNMINEHGQKIDELGKKVDDVNKSVIESATRMNLENHDKKITATSSSVSELNGKIDALSTLMKQILEVNRKILTELEMKK